MIESGLPGAGAHFFVLRAFLFQKSGLGNEERLEAIARKARSRKTFTTGEIVEQHRT